MTQTPSDDPRLAVPLADLLRAARAAELQASVQATLKYKGVPFSGGQKADARVRAAVAEAMYELAKEFRSIGDGMNDRHPGNDPFLSGLIQGAYDADARLFKWASEVEQSA